jgi:4-amino-4-deoxy-L-arabinose transferase-like glycosyltransferase
MKHTRRDTGLLIVLLLLLVALAAGVRFYNLGGQSLWSDEGNSAALASRSFAQIARDAANDIHPPLYYWLLRLWTGVFGTSEAGLRSLSALLGTLLVLAVFGLGTRLFNRTTGLAAAFIAAITPFQVYYSQEARMYILAALEAALAVLLFWWFLSQEDNRLPAGDGQAEGSGAGLKHAGLRLLPFSGQLLVLTWVAGLYTHYAFPLLVGLLSVLYLGWLIVSRRRGLVGWRLMRWGVLLALALGLYAAWLTTALRQLSTWPRVEAHVELLAQFRVLSTTLGLGPVAQGQANQWWVWVLPALAALGALPWPFSNRQGQQGTARLDWLRWFTPVAWAVAPIAMILALGLFREAYLKFLLIASPACALLLARAVLGPTEWLIASPRRSADAPAAPARPWWQSLASVAWVLLTLATIGALSGATLARYYTDPAVARDDYRGIVQFIEATAHPNDAIVLTAPGQAEVFNYYYDGDLPVYALPRQRPLDLEATVAELTKLLEYDKVYMVNWAAAEADPTGVIPAWMDSQGYKMLDQWRGNVRLAVYVMPEHRPPEEIVENLNLRFGPDLELLGYRGWKLAPTAGEVTQLQLRWRADRTPDRRYKVFLQLLDPRDQVIAQRDAEPAGAGRPTDTWKPGEVVLDNHGLLIPPGTPPGTYRRIIGMYDPQTMERLKLPDGRDFVSLSPVTVARAKTTPPLAALNMQHGQLFDFGGITLLGYDRYKRGFGHAPDTPICPGDRLHLTFYWQANVTPRADWWFDLALSDSGGRTVASLQAPLVSETYGTTMWQEGEIVRGEHDLQLPADLPPDTYRLSLVLLPDAKTPAGTAYLGTVRVEEPPTQASPGN